MKFKILVAILATLCFFLYRKDIQDSHLELFIGSFLMVMWLALGLTSNIIQQRQHYLALVITFCAFVATQILIILSAVLVSSGALSVSSAYQMCIAAFVAVSLVAVATAFYIHRIKRSGGAGSGD